MFNNDVKIYDYINRRFIPDPKLWELGELSLNGIIVCHYIGQNDYYNNKLYEYSIVQSYNDDNTIHGTYYIKYIKNLCKFNIDANVIKSKQIKLIGNVFEHAYLLPEKYHDKLEKELGFQLINKRLIVKKENVK